MLVPKIYKTVYLTDILAFLKHCYGNSFNETHERSKMIESMDGKLYIEYTKEMFKDRDIKIYYHIREMREEGILPKEFIVINNL